VRLIPGKPGQKLSAEYAAARFTPDEEWRLTVQRNLAWRVSRPAALTAFSTAPTRFRYAVGRETHRANAQVALYC